MRYVTNTLAGSDVSREQKHGREYLAFPAILAREMVLNYPEWDRKELLPAERIAESAPAWADAPVTVNHPPERDGAQDARVPESYTSEVVGRVFRPNALENGQKLRGEVWVDVEKARALGGQYEQVVNQLEAGETVQVSTGYATVDDDPSGGQYEGEQYDLEQGRLIPNHLALVTSDRRARCDPSDGCAAPRANAQTAGMRRNLDPPEEHSAPSDDTPAESVGRAVLNAVAGALPGGDQAAGSGHGHDHGHADDCGCGGACADCSDRTNSGADGQNDDDEDPDDADPSDEEGDGDGDADGDEESGDDADPSDEEGDDGDDEDPDDSDDDDSDDADSNSDMSDRISRLAEETSFSSDELERFDDSQLDTLEAGIKANADDGDGDGDDDPDTTDEGDDDEKGGLDADPSDDGGDDSDVEEKVNTLLERVNQLEQEKEELEAKATGEYQRRQRVIDRIVANAEPLDEDDREDLESMSMNTLENTARSLGVAVDPDSEPTGKAAMGGVSTGSPDRANAEESSAPAPGRSNWEEQRAGGDD